MFIYIFIYSYLYFSCIYLYYFNLSLLLHYRPCTRIENCNVPPPSDGVTRLNNIKILGVIGTDTLSFEMHISGVISKCAQTSYALRILRAHGLNGQALWDVTRSTLVSKLMYAYLDGAEVSASGLKIGRSPVQISPKTNFSIMIKLPVKSTEK